jgi:deoxycytidylate deaminase
MTPGACAKRRVRCTIITADGNTFVGENVCGNPQVTCPRMEDEGYEKCSTVCAQFGHAEEMALVSMFMAGASGAGATAFIQGHTRACSKCQDALREAGVARIYFGEPYLRDTDGWCPVVGITDLTTEGHCPNCRIEYADCPCPGPTDEDTYEYRWLGTSLLARKKQALPSAVSLTGR